MRATPRSTVERDATDAPEQGYTEWRCTNCDNTAPKNNPPCRRCGNMSFDQVAVRASDFDDETRATGRVEILRENTRVVAAALAVVAVVVAATLASAGVFVVADPVFGYRYGAVTPAPADGDGTLTAAEFHGRVAADNADTSLAWSGRTLELSYRSGATDGDSLTTELFGIAVVYADYVDGGGDAARLQITARVGDRPARVVVDSRDAAAFATEELSRTDYRDRVVG